MNDKVPLIQIVRKIMDLCKRAGEFEAKKERYKEQFAEAEKKRDKEYYENLIDEMRKQRDICMTAAYQLLDFFEVREGTVLGF